MNLFQIVAALKNASVDLEPVSRQVVGANAICKGCGHAQIKETEGGWCYMFKDPPSGTCTQHTKFNLRRK